MSPLSLLLLLLGAAGVLLAAGLYLRVEEPVRGRSLLLALRVAVLVLLTLLLVNPVVPGVPPESRTAGPASWVLLDPDLSLAARGDDGVALWERALERAGEEAASGARLAVPGPEGMGPEGVDPASLQTRRPSHPPGDLPGAVRGLAEVGADTVRILSTFRNPPAFLEALGATTPVPLRLERIGGTVRNAGVAELALPGSVREGDEVEGRLALVHEGVAPGDSAWVEIRADGLPVRSFRMPLEVPAGRTELPLRLPAPPDTGQVRYTARVTLDRDAFPADDERIRRVRVGEAEGGVLLISLRPDWEPRTLLPVLTAVTGLPGEGFLGMGEGLLLPLVAGEGPSGAVTPEELESRMGRARLLVIHGVAAEPPEWVARAARSHPRVLHVPAGQAGARLAGIEVAGPFSGEWILDPDLPPGPVAPYLRDLTLGGLPPLTGVMPPAAPSAVAALRVRDPARGDPLPVVLLRESDEGRRVVALASGFWRWGARTGEARRAYRGLWAGVADWLLALPGVVPDPGVRPSAPVQPRGHEVEWGVPPGLDDASVTLTPMVGEVFQAPLHPDADGRARIPALEPGTYRYRAVALRSVSGDEVTTEGEVEVEAWAPSLMLPPLDVPGAIPAGTGMIGAAGAGEGGRALRTFALPWIVVVLLLCGEWIGRRRMGLR